MHQPLPVLIRAGKSALVTLEVDRDRFHGPIKIEGSSLPEGFTLDPVQFEPDQDQVELKVSAAKQTPPGIGAIELVFRGAKGQESSAPLRYVVIRDGFRLLPPGPLVLASGTKLALPVELERDGYKRPVALGIRGRPEDQQALRPSSSELGKSLALHLDIPPNQQESAGELLLQAYAGGMAAGDPVVVKYQVKPCLRLLTGKPNPVQYLALSPDGQRIAAGLGDEVVIWNSRTGQEVRRFKAHSGGVVGLDWSQDGFLLASVGQEGGPVQGDVKGRARVWDPATRKEVIALEQNDKQLQCLAINPAATRLAAGDVAGQLHIWDLETGKLIQSEKCHSQAILEVVWSLDRRWLAVASQSGEVTIHETTGLAVQKKLAGHEGGASSLAFRGDSKELAVGTGKGKIHCWQVPTGKELRVWQGHEGTIFGLQYSSDGTRLLTGSQDKLARVWDTRTGELFLTLTGHSDAVTGVGYAPDDARIVTGSWDKTVRVWDVKTGK